MEVARKRCLTIFAQPICVVEACTPLEDGLPYASLLVRELEVQFARFLGPWKRIHTVPRSAAALVQDKAFEAPNGTGRDPLPAKRHKGAAMRTTPSIVARLVVSLSLVGSAAVGMPAAGSAQAAPERILVGASSDDVVRPLLYAVDAGLFKKAGLDVELVKLSNGAAVAAAVAGGSVQLGKGSALTPVQAYAKGSRSSSRPTSPTIRPIHPTSPCSCRTTRRSVPRRISSARRSGWSA